MEIAIMAATIDSPHRIQSIPDVTTTPRDLAAASPMKAPTIPSTVVHNSEMFYCPLRSSRARPPTTAPMTIVHTNPMMLNILGLLQRRVTCR